MNHCIDCICSSCGAWYCILNCDNSKEQGHNPVIKQAFSLAVLEGAKPHHYKHNVCRYCNSLTMYAAPANIYEAITKVNHATAK